MLSEYIKIHLYLSHQHVNSLLCVKVIPTTVINTSLFDRIRIELEVSDPGVRVNKELHPHP